jgi:3-methyladenine DNA glycosylase/8-oxoguanine DNA glycosylase
MSGAAGGSSAVLALTGPFDLALSLRAAASFWPAQGTVPPVLRAGLHIDGRPAIIEIRQNGEQPQQVVASITAPLGAIRLRAIAGRLIGADLDLRPFYALSADHPVMGPVVKALKGVKPLRPASLFEMLIVAITEQQLSLAAAFYIRRRLVERFGTQRDGVWIFPTPVTLAAASLAELATCGLSRRKAEYIRDVAGEIAAGRLDLDALAGMTDAEAHGVLARQRGFGAWSIQYVLTRGLGRPDCLPAGDVGLRRVVGRYLCGGRRLAPGELERALAPFAPFRSLAAYYLAVHARLFRRSLPSPSALPISG